MNRRHREVVDISQLDGTLPPSPHLSSGGYRPQEFCPQIDADKNYFNDSFCLTV